MEKWGDCSGTVAHCQWSIEFIRPDWAVRAPDRHNKTDTGLPVPISRIAPQSSVRRPYSCVRAVVVGRGDAENQRFMEGVAADLPPAAGVCSNRPPLHWAAILARTRLISGASIATRAGHHLPALSASWSHRGIGKERDKRV